jgi:hypothetical protein
LPRFASILLAVGCAVGAAAAQLQPLDRGWQIVADPGADLNVNTASTRSDWRDARVGLSWNAQFADMRDYMGVAWYRTKFQLPNFTAHKRVLLRFHAVDYLTEVFVNGVSAGVHEGGYTPFAFDVTQFAKPGTNELVVRVYDPPMQKDGEKATDAYAYNEIPHGKQNWYVQNGGIWQGVELDIRPELYISSVHITPQVDGTVVIAVDASSNSAVQAKIFGPDGGLLAQTSGNAGEPLSVKIDSPLLWSPDAPHLYNAEISIAEDTVRERFGFRELVARDGQFFLNGKPFYMIAALDQDFYPETIYTAPSETYIRDAMRKGKQLGLNVLRCHIKVCEPAYLRAADEVGMLVWYEIPSWADFEFFTPKAGERGEAIFRGMVARDWNHPSVAIMSVINESWGANLREHAEQRQWLRAAFQRAKDLTAPRGILVVDNSACCGNFHIKTDINDFHEYKSFPDYRAEWEPRIRDFASRPKWTFSPHGDAEPTGKEPLVLSEFGNWGLPELPARLPWWFDRDFAGREVTRPAGVRERFRQFQFGRIFSDFNALARATQWHQFDSLKYEIEDLRQHEDIRGYVITEFTDINWEVNGLMDMWRQPKVYAAELAKIQKPDLVFARADQRNVYSGAKVSLPAYVSHYSSRDLGGAVIAWRTSRNSGTIPVAKNLCSACVAQPGTVMFTAPAVTRPTRERVWLELRSAEGERLAENSIDLFVYPPSAMHRTAVVLSSDLPGILRAALVRAGYQSRAKPLPSDLLIASGWNTVVNAHIAKGGRALLLLDNKDSLPAASGLTVTPRQGSDLDGNWVTNFNWIDPESRVFRSLSFAPVLGWEAAQVTPRFIIQGVKADDYNRVFSGIFYGWLNNNAALAMKTADQRATLTTFRFTAYGKDPYATHLLDNLIREAAAQ